LVDIGDGKDLAAVCIEDCDKKFSEEIAEYVSANGVVIKTNEGDKDHKKRIGPTKFLPSFIVGIIMEITAFLTVHLGFAVPPLGLRKFPFGGACITSVGMMGI